MNSNQNKIALITGAAGGIGTAIAEKLSKETDLLILVDINSEKIKKMQNAINKSCNIKTHLCDVGDYSSVEEMIKNLLKENIVPTILINNAGIGGPFHRIDEVSDTEWHSIMNTNLKSIFNLSKLLLPKMKEHKFGRIINISSIQGFLGSALSSTYVASKHGVIGYTRAIAAEWGQYGITCNAICPGYVDSAMGIQDDKINQHHRKVIERTPAGRLATTHEIANIVSFLTNDQSSFINGSIFTVDGGLSCHTGTT